LECGGSDAALDSRSANSEGLNEEQAIQSGVAAAALHNSVFQQPAKKE